MAWEPMKPVDRLRTVKRGYCAEMDRLKAQCSAIDTAINEIEQWEREIKQAAKEAAAEKVKP